jgi:hypothetical protein
MNAAIAALFIGSAMVVGQPLKPVFREPRIDVFESAVQKDGSTYHYVLHNRIYIGRNYGPPKNEKDRGKPSVDFSRLPTTYFHDKSPIGMVMHKYNWFPGPTNTYAADARLPASMIGIGEDLWGQLTNLWSEPPVAVLGMDVATMASYARPAQIFHFTERIPTFVKLSFPEAKGKRFFHFAQHALDRGAAFKVFEGEPREVFEKNVFNEYYQIVVIETYKLPVVEIHKELMTREAVQLLLSRTRHDGILCFHTSNRYYDLVPVLASTAKELKLACLHGSDRAFWKDDQRHKDRFTSDWVLIARDWDHLAHLKPPMDYEKQENRFGENAPFWDPPKNTDKKYIWTDAGENTFRGIYRSDPKIDLLADRIREFEDWISDITNMPQLEQHTQPFYDAMHRWSKSSADAMNRDDFASKKSEKDKK